MRAGDLRRALESATNIAVLLVAVAAISSLATNYFRRPSHPTLVAGLQTGAVLGTIPSLDGHNNTLLVALNTNCSFCKESLPLYRKLIEANKSNKTFRIVAIFPDSPEEVKSYVRANDFAVDTIGEVKLGSLGISGIPSLILLNRNGKVDDFWIGKLKDAEAEQLIRFLTSPQH